MLCLCHRIIELSNNSVQNLVIRRHLYRVNFRRALDFVQFYSEKKHAI